MKTLKAGCILINKDSKNIALVYRKKQNDYSFPKGHVEKNEEIIDAAIRETAEETKRKAEIIKNFEPYVESYKTPSGEDCVCFMYIALDAGISDNDSQDTHPVVWTPFEMVEETLSYQSLKDMWNILKEKIAKFLEK